MKIKYNDQHKWFYQKNLAFASRMIDKYQQVNGVLRFPNLIYVKNLTPEIGYIGGGNRLFRNLNKIKNYTYNSIFNLDLRLNMLNDHFRESILQIGNTGSDKSIQTESKYSDRVLEHTHVIEKTDREFIQTKAREIKRGKPGTGILSERLKLDRVVQKISERAKLISGGNHYLTEENVSVSGNTLKKEHSIEPKVKDILAGTYKKNMHNVTQTGLINQGTHLPTPKTSPFSDSVKRKGEQVNIHQHLSGDILNKSNSSHNEIMNKKYFIDVINQEKKHLIRQNTNQYALHQEILEQYEESHEKKVIELVNTKKFSENLFRNDSFTQTIDRLVNKIVNRQADNLYDSFLKKNRIDQYRRGIK